MVCVDVDKCVESLNMQRYWILLNHLIKNQL